MLGKPSPLPRQPGTPSQPSGPQLHLTPFDFVNGAVQWKLGVPTFLYPCALRERDGLPCFSWSAYSSCLEILSIAL